MKHRYSALLLASLTVVALGLSSPMARAQSTNIKETKTVANYKVELEILPPEPFYTKADVQAKDVSSGMVVEGGETPLDVDDPSDPNHHLIVHVFDKSSGKVVTDANVVLGFEPINLDGKTIGNMTYVPTVIMQAIGKGADSTHYGNNVVMKAGHYQVVCMVNGKTVLFRVHL